MSLQKLFINKIGVIIERLQNKKHCKRFCKRCGKLFKWLFEAIFDEISRHKNNVCKVSFAIANVQRFSISLQIICKILVKYVSIFCKNAYKKYIGHYIFYINKIYICNIYMVLQTFIIGCYYFDEKIINY